MTEGGETSNGEARSELIDHGSYESRCGYCKSPGRTSVAHGFSAIHLTVEDYQELLDRGWRRSGCFLYKPDMEKTCCPPYTIRLKAGSFVPSKDQTRVRKKMIRFLHGKMERANRLQETNQENPKSNKSLSSQSLSHISPGVDVSGSQMKQPKELNQKDKLLCLLSDKINDAINLCLRSQDLPCKIQLPKAIVKKVKNQVKKKLLEATDNLMYTSSVSFQIAALLRHSSIELASDSKQENYMHSPNIIAEKLVSNINELGNLPDFFVKACNGHINFYFSSQHVGIVEVSAPCLDHGGHPKVISNSRDDRKHHEDSADTFRGHRLEIRMNKSSFDPEEYALYCKYQIKVHNDRPEEVTEASYNRFLVDTPLIFRSAMSNDRGIPSSGFGSFHQQYLIDGKLVAVGVVDILPKCLSSKYLFWDPDFAFLSLGKYSALMEIDWIREAEVNCASLQYYYLGYYIHSCSKMRYKAAYHPSELLCPLRYQWVPFCVAKPLLDKGERYVVLSDSANEQNIAVPPHFPMNSTMMLMDNDSDGEDSVGYANDEDAEMELVSEHQLLSVWNFDTVHLPTNDGETGDVINNVILGLDGSGYNFQDFESGAQEYLEPRLRTFISMVGDKLSSRVIYHLR